MALTPTEQDPASDTNSILEWYDTSRPLFIDLVGDYAGKELFLVEGDSMLRECFGDERIDFQGNQTPAISSREQMQPLTLFITFNYLLPISSMRFLSLRYSWKLKLSLSLGKTVNQEAMSSG